MSYRKDDVAAATGARSGLLRAAVFWLTIVLCAGPSGDARGAEALAIDANTGKVTIGVGLDVTGTIRSSNGGFQFPDGTTQTTAALPAGAVIAFNLDACPAGWAEFTSAHGRFIRGIDKSGKKIDPDGPRLRESTQEDAIQNIRGSISGVEGATNRAWSWGFKPGSDGAVNVPFSFGTYNKYAGDYGPNGGVGGTAIFDASKVVRTAEENRPKNVALLDCEKK